MSKLYVAIDRFKDLQDDGFEYRAGMIYPRKGVEVTESRINELSSSKNLMGKVLIAELIGFEDNNTEDNNTEDNNTEDNKKTKKTKSKKTE